MGDGHLAVACPSPPPYRASVSLESAADLGHRRRSGRAAVRATSSPRGGILGRGHESAGEQYVYIGEASKVPT